MNTKFVVAFAVFAASLAFLGVASAQQEERITLTTYYPAPYGAYSRLRIMGDNDPNTPDLEIGGTGGNATVTVNGVNSVGLWEVIRRVNTSPYALKIGTPNGGDSGWLTLSPGEYSIKVPGKSTLFANFTASTAAVIAGQAQYVRFIMDGAPLSGVAYLCSKSPSFPVPQLGYLMDANCLSFSRIIITPNDDLMHTIEVQMRANPKEFTIYPECGMLNIMVFRNPGQWTYTSPP